MSEMTADDFDRLKARFLAATRGRESFESPRVERLCFGARNSIGDSGVVEIREDDQCVYMELVVSHDVALRIIELVANDPVPECQISNG